MTEASQSVRTAGLAHLASLMRASGLDKNQSLTRLDVDEDSPSIAIVSILSSLGVLEQSRAESRRTRLIVTMKRERVIAE